MFIERRLVSNTQKVELWECEWENAQGVQARKVFLRKIGEEQPLAPEDAATLSTSAICWSYGRTLGNIAVFSSTLLGRFPGQSGSDATLPCDFVHAGKFRHGAERWWCRTHQTHWGTKADQESYSDSRAMICANHAQPMHYVVGPLETNAREYAEMGIWCSLPAAMSTQSINPRAPKIHVHLRREAAGKKVVDADFAAIALLYNEDLGLFGNHEITRVNITPPAAFEFVCALEFGRELSCINCSHCGYPHLDLGDFAKKAHRKHFCANCGRDSTWSKGPIVSTPLKPLHDQLAKNSRYERPSRRLNLDEYPGCDYALWASTPAVLWTATRAQEQGIHAHVHDGKRRIIDDTFGEVILDGRPLDRSELLQKMLDRTII